MRKIIDTKETEVSMGAPDIDAEREQDIANKAAAKELQNGPKQDIIIA
ncbi:MAG: hypothetical protein WC303_01785 [Candidatus Paceibacterota bacterium]|jgi:hypothetical protein